MQEKNRYIENKLIALAMLPIFLVILLCFATNYDTVINIGTISNKADNKTNNLYDRIADPNTMDTYKDFLLNSKNGSRYAGRIWSDKSVFTFNNSMGKLVLDNSTDGIDKTISYDSDFLHVYSTLGSSLKEKSEVSSPIDAVFIIDLSGSMAQDVVCEQEHQDETERIAHTRIHATVTAVNDAIDTLMDQNEANRVSVVVYGTTAYTLMELGHYEKNDENTPYITVERVTQYDEKNGKSTKNSAAYTLHAHAKKDGTSSIDRTVRNNYEQNMDQTEVEKLNAVVGFHTNLQAGIYQGFNELYKNMTEVKDVTYTFNSALTNERITIPRIPVAIVMSDGASNFSLKKPETQESAGDEWYNVPIVDKMYSYNTEHQLFRTETNEKGRGGKETILEILLTASFMKSKVQNKYSELLKKANLSYDTFASKLNVMTVSVDTPSGDSAKWQTPRLYTTLDPKNYFKSDLQENWDFVEDATEAYKLWEQWQQSSDGVTSTFKDTDYGSTKKEVTIKIGKLSGTVDGVSNEDIVKNIAYNDSFEDIKANGLDDFFESLLHNIFNSNNFTPVSGYNDFGVGNSVTYMDPIGKYLTVKDKAISIDGTDYDMGLLLFGELHNLRKAAIYDYTFNSTHRGESHDSNDMKLPFTSGWYDKDGKYLSSGGSWENGDTYYADVSQVQKYVPTLDETNNITDKQKHTIYTLYSFSDEDADKDQQNPCYDGNMTYKLNDIRVWTENTENYVDEDDEVIAPELGFDNALYVNIPVAALPLQVANVEIDHTHGKVKSYSDNTSDKKKSTPLRLFYSVGIDDDIMTEDGLDIDIAKIDQEYIKANKKDDTVYFYSNYYSKMTYDGYVTDTENERTRGDASFSFSPGSTNRYYIFQKALPLYEVDTNDFSRTIGGYKEIPLETKEEYEEFTNSHKTISEAKDLSSDKWYYIVIDYYLPEKDTLMHLAVARQGKEFGSGIAGGSIDAGHYLSWYSPSTDKYVDFDSSGTKPTDATDYIIATRPGGLRTGDLAQSLRQKEQNNTQTSRSYFLPTVSSTSTDNIVIDTYLGNNGRLAVNDSLMMVAKEVETSELGSEKIDKNRDYKFTLQLEDHEGDYSFIKMHKNPYSNEWQLRLSTIDVLTSNDGFLQDKDTKLYVYEKDGEQYYIYIGDNKISGDTGGDDVFRVYSAPDNDNHITLTKSGMTTYVTDPNAIDNSLKSDLNKYKEVDDENTLGSIDFWIDKVYLIPKEEYDDKSWNSKAKSSYETISEFVIAHLDSMKKGVDELSSDYSTSTSYLTTTLYFGYSESNKPSAKPESWSDAEWNNQQPHIAQFTLKDDEGLMLSGLKAGSDYVLTEILTEDDNKEGYYFDSIKLDEGEVDVPIVVDKTVKGRINANYIDEAVYVNKFYAPTQLAIKKEVSGLLGDKDKEWQFDIKLTTLDNIVLKDSYKYHYEVIDGVTKRSDGQLSFTSLGDNQYSAQVKVKHGETVVIEDLPEGTTYEVSEVEANANGYITTSSENTKGTLEQEKQELSYQNAKYESYNINITKEIKGEEAEEKEWILEIVLTPKEGTHFDSSYNYKDGSKNGVLYLTKNEENKYTGELRIKSGHTITIEGLHEDTQYKITEKEANENGYITLTDNEEGTLTQKETNVKFTNIKYSRHKLTIGKKVTGGASDKEKEWTFDIELTPGNDVIFDNSYSYTGGTIVDGVAKHDDGTLNFEETGGVYKASITLKHGQTITINNLPERTKYKVTEREADADEYTTFVTDNADSTLTKEEEQVIFTNRKLTKEDITISKEVKGAWADQEKEWKFRVILTPDSTFKLEKSYKYTGSKEGQMDLTDNEDGTYTGVVTLKHGENITIKDLPEGTRYKIEEVEANQDGYSTRVEGKAEDVLTANMETPVIKYTNIKLSQHSLTISKEVMGSAGDKDKKWEFIITLTPAPGVQLLDSYPVTGGSISEDIDYIESDTVSVSHNANGTSEIKIKLKHGQSLTINDLPEGTKYKVEEVDANTDEYITREEGNNEGTLEDNSNESIKYINLKPSKHDIVISKEVAGGAGEKDRAWTFKITLTPDEEITLKESYTCEGIDSCVLKLEKQEDGTSVGTLTLVHGQTVTIKNLPEKTLYKVEEEEANTDEYITEIDGETEGILTGEAPEIMFKNTKLSKHNLSISKEVNGDAGDRGKLFTMKVKLVAPSIQDLNESYSYHKNDGSIGNITLKEIADKEYETQIRIHDGETVTIEDLPEGTAYEVTEVEANQDGYDTEISSNSKGVLDGETPEIKVRNSKFSKYQIVITKTVLGKFGEIDRDWTLEIKLKPDSSYNGLSSLIYQRVNQDRGIINLTRDGEYYVGTVTIRHGEVIILEDIPYKTEYEIKELEADQGNYETTNGYTKNILTDNTVIGIVNARYVDDSVLLPNTADTIMKYFTNIVSSLILFVLCFKFLTILRKGN